MNNYTLMSFASVIILGLIQPNAQAQNAPGELKTVTKGIFVLNENQSIDLMDRGIMLHLYRVNGNVGEAARDVSWTINGSGGASNIGTRHDLKNRQGVAEFVKDRSICVIDIVSAVKPAGGAASATFRLLCE
jgi:hypothetical protein